MNLNAFFLELSDFQTSLPIPSWQLQDQREGRKAGPADCSEQGNDDAREWWLPLFVSDVHTEAVQAALAKHKERKMAVPMPSKRRSLVVQTSMDAYTPPGEQQAPPAS